MSWKEKINNMFTAITFAEAGEHDTALEMMGQVSSQKNEKSWLSALNNIFTAATFAEADCHDIALEYLDQPAAAKTQKVFEYQPVKLKDFVASVGLEGVQLRFGLVQAL